jgi:hypothetical protein
MSGLKWIVDGGEIAAATLEGQVMCLDNQKKPISQIGIDREMADTASAARLLATITNRCVYGVRGCEQRRACRAMRRFRPVRVAGSRRITMPHRAPELISE